MKTQTLEIHYRPISADEHERILMFGHPPRPEAWHTCNICGTADLRSARALAEHKRICYNKHKKEIT